MADDPFSAELAKRQADPFTAELTRRQFQPTVGVEANQPMQFAAPGQPVQAPALSPTEEIEQLILSARMRQGRPREPRTPSELEFARRSRLAANAALFGFAGELGAQFSQLVNDLTDEEAARLEQLMDQEIQQARTERPGETLAVEIGAAGAGAPGALATRMMGVPATLGQTVVRGGTAGGAVGALTGAGEAPAGERLTGAGSGALAGAGLGAAAPLILSATGAGLRAIVNRLRPGTTQRNAADRVLRSLDDGEISLQEAQQRLDRLGLEGTLADVSDETRRLLRGAASEPGRTSAQATRLLEGRQDAQGARILAAVEQNMPKMASFQGTVDDLTAIRQRAADPLYTRAYARDIPFTDELQELFNRPAIKQAWEGAQELAANKNIRLPQIFIRDAQGNLTLNTRAAPTTQTIDFIKRSLDDIVERNRDQQTLRIIGDRAKSVRDVRRDLLQIVDELNPEYPTARAAFAGPSGSLDALNMGRRFARGDPEILNRQLARLTENDRAFFQMGALQEIRDIVNRTPDGVNAARRLAGNELARQRLREVFPDQQSFDNFMSRIDAETEMFRTRQMVQGGSPTARIQAEQSQLAEPLTDVAIDVATGTPGVGTGRRLLGAMMGRGGRPDPAVIREIGRMLTAQGDDLTAVLQQLQARQGAGRSAAEIQALINALGTAGISGLPSR